MNKTLIKCFRRFVNLCCRRHISIGSKVECPICKWTGSNFLSYAYPYKPKEVLFCPSCGSLERHRFAFFVLKDKIEASENTLHIAPEEIIESWLRKISKNYLSIDLSSSSAMKHMDITNLEIDDNQFSLIWCFHVLEHIGNDQKAIAELYRVLSPLGLAIIAVPIYGENTYENNEINTPQERLIHYKQEDHVRLYGMDIVNKLKNAGFSVDVIHTHDCDQKDIRHFGLEYPSTKEIFICKKRNSACLQQSWD